MCMTRDHVLACVSFLVGVHHVTRIFFIFGDLKFQAKFWESNVSFFPVAVSAFAVGNSILNFQIFSKPISVVEGFWYKDSWHSNQQGSKLKLGGS